MKISIITPTNNPKWLGELYNSIKDSNYLEWVLFPNGGVRIGDIPYDIIRDRRTTLITGNGRTFDERGLVGEIKAYCCEMASGDILVEVDHDDILVDGAIDEIRLAFESHPGISLCYSNCAEFDDETGAPYTYNPQYGWQTRPFEYRGRHYEEIISPEPSPYHCSHIYYAPNHVRAFSKEAYLKCGGYRPLSVLDDQDLICRLYTEGDFYHINKCLYLYRVHGDNTWLARNAEIQTNTAKVGQMYLYSMIEAWCKRNNLLMLDIGGGIDSPEEYVSVDMHDAQVVADLDNDWPFESDSVGYIRAFDIIEHLKSPIHTMSEIHRVLVPGGYCSILVPSTDGRGAFQDPTHISFWNENSFWYYTDKRYARYIRNDSIRFLDIFLYTFFPTEWHMTSDIPYVRADLMALKNGVAYHGVRKI